MAGQEMAGSSGHLRPLPLCRFRGAGLAAQDIVVEKHRIAPQHDATAGDIRRELRRKGVGVGVGQFGHYRLGCGGIVERLA